MSDSINAFGTGTFSKKKKIIIIIIIMLLALGTHFY